MPSQPVKILLVAASVGFAVGACGGGDDELATPGQTGGPGISQEPSPDSSGTEPPSDDAGDDEGDAGASEDTGSEWIDLTDEPSGARFALPSQAEPMENTAPVSDGSTVSLRNYSAMTLDGLVEVGFNVIDTPGDEYSFEAGVDGVASTLDGEVVDSTEIDVDGNAGVDVEMTYGEGYVVLFQLITTEDHIIQTLASGPQAERAVVEDVYQQLNESLEVR